ncbi:hypothetical protein FMM58_04030 [Campylobacter sp. LR291e]|uniref:HdrB C-terminal domain-containing protein n=1 Tax=Campylobacter sp. LR291e TaxID=2593546 RepID=UPI0012399D8C|nr:DUF5644 domain-containing protein [Campylobacter sp. LR291e]KAA6230866.1 hypothetical protein FMM58_04030 [Campylobacter sp. LR291e]
MKELELRIFRFDKDKDYEAYYKPYVYKNYENFAMLYDLLLQIQDDDIYFSFDKNESSFVLVNKQAFSLSTPLSEILQLCGFELIIQPLSTKRAVYDLIIDKSDFLDKFKLIEELVSKEDKKLYEGLDYLYYTSEILEYLPEYLGDSFFYFVNEMIQKYPLKKRKFLSLIADKERGIFYHLSTKNENLEKIISNLQNEILKEGLFDKKLLKANLKDDEIKKNHLSSIKYDFKDFNIACYGFNPCENLRAKIKANFVDYDFKSKSSPYTLLNLNENLAYKIAANIILDAYDSGSDFLVVAKNNDFYLFDTCAKKLMNESGRDFDDFYVLTRAEFISLIGGEVSSSLKNHNLKVSLI